MKYILKQELVFELTDELGKTITDPKEKIVSALGFVKLSYTFPNGIESSTIVTEEQFLESFYPHDMEARQIYLGNAAKAAESRFTT